MIKIRCKECKKLLKLPFNKVPKGRVRVKCPNCSHINILKKKPVSSNPGLDVLSKGISPSREQGKIRLSCPSCGAKFFIRTKRLPKKVVRIRCRKCFEYFTYNRPENKKPQAGLTRETVQSIIGDFLEDQDKEEFNEDSNVDMLDPQDDIQETIFDDVPQKEETEFSLSSNNTETDPVDLDSKSMEEDWEKELFKDTQRDNDTNSSKDLESMDALKDDIKTLEQDHKLENNGKNSIRVEKDSEPTIDEPVTKASPTSARVIHLPIKDNVESKRHWNTDRGISEYKADVFHTSKPATRETVYEGGTRGILGLATRTLRLKYKWITVITIFLGVVYLASFRQDLLRGWFMEPLSFLFSDYMEKTNYEKAQTLYTQGDYELAKNAIDRALENNPGNKDYRSLQIACKLWLNSSLLKDITSEGPLAIHGLKDMLIQSDDVQLKSKVVDAMSRLGNPVVVPVLLKTYHENIPTDLKRKIIEALGTLKDPSSITVLNESIESKDATIRFAACAALGDIGSQDGISALSKTLRDPDFTVRYKAAESLQKIGGKKSSLTLAEALNDPKVENKENILISMGKIGDPSVVNTIGKIFRDNLRKGGDLLLRHTATVALGEIGSKESFRILKDAVMRPETPDKQDIVAAMGKIEGREVIECLTYIITNKRKFSRTVKREAAYCLLEKGNPSTLATLKQAVKMGLLDKSDLDITMRKHFQ